METKRGLLKDFDAGTYKASVQLPGSLAVWLSGVHVSRNIAGAEMINGRQVALLLFDASNPNDAVLTAVWT